MDFSEAYRKVVNSGIFVVCNGAPAGVYRLRTGRRFELFKQKQEQAKTLKQIIDEADGREPAKLTEGELHAIQAPVSLVHDLAMILLAYHLEKNSEIDLESIVEAGARDELSSSLTESQKAVAEKYRWSKDLAREILPQIQKAMKTPKAAHLLFLPCVEAFRRYLGIGTDAAYRYTAILLSGAGIVEGDAKQIYSRIKTGIHRSKA